MTVAERTRAAVRAEPFVYEALRAGVLNYTAAARYLDVGDESAVSAALRRTLVVVVSRSDGPNALRAVEDALDA